MTVSKRDFLTGMAGGTLAAGAASAATPKVTASPADARKLIDYFAGNAKLLLRQPGGYLKYPSISPSLPKSQYSTEQWDWDTMWTVRGLFHVARLTNDAALRKGIAEHARGALANFFDHQSKEGRIPMLITVKNPDPLHCLEGERPNPRNQAKPVLAQLALMAADETGDISWFEPWFNHLLRFYESWTQDNLKASGLLVWGNDVAIGNDNDPTTFGRPEFSSANLLLNCLYYNDLKAAAEIAKRLGKADWQKTFTDRLEPLARAIHKHNWDARDRFFYTADVQCRDRRAELIPNIPRGMDMDWQTIPLRIQTFTGFLPLWCGLATKDQAEALRQHSLDPRTFHSKAGVRSLSAAESMYDLRASTNPSNWLGPVWIVVNYFVWRGLKNYGFTTEAADLSAKTVKLLADDLTASGSLNEYYHPDTAKALSHKGFMNWNLLVLEMIEL
ncbi:trehalase family glycosidase [Asticcacaulis sp. BYS171W]|uniref:Trehalase family glycosidase n=1 Tax=Asticcacaulis aquaticus TaxID=2984212 RepID=A0ABT5HVW2_9CAUL|nr:trehalase family glycosidase [Asticcacaulis aquaticus]MDC7684184.1 trehalase family glycosidase [Asticcacaulis aquaticus]